jgi:hypothetical protein
MVHKSALRARKRRISDALYARTIARAGLAFRDDPFAEFLGDQKTRAQSIVATSFCINPSSVRC